MLDMLNISANLWRGVNERFAERFYAVIITMVESFKLIRWVKIKSIIVTLCLCLNITVAQAQPTVLQQAEMLISQGKSESAVEILTEIADENIGSPDFDYIYGLSLLETGQYTMAVFALERSLMSNPDDIRVQAALARSYYTLKEYVKADALIKKVRQHDPSSWTEEVARQMRHTKSNETKKRKKSRLSGFVRTSFGSDSNLTNGPMDNYITLPAAVQYGSVYVGNSIVKNAAEYFSADGALQYQIPLQHGLSLNGGIQASQRIYNNVHDEDLASATVWFGGQYETKKQRLKLNVRFQEGWLGGVGYWNQLGLFTQWHRKIQANKAFAFYVDANINKYLDSSTYNSNNYTVGGIYYHQFSTIFLPKSSFQLSGSREKMKTNAASYLGYNQAGITINNRFQLTTTNSLLLTLAYEGRRYHAADSYFFMYRKDRAASLSCYLTHTMFSNYFSVSLRGSLLRNRSNIALYDYRRNTVSVESKWKF